MARRGAKTAAMVVIGDEVLSGRTRDANAHHLAGVLTEIGVDLIEVRFVRDETAEIVAAVNALRAAVDYLFTSGGIGPTHDDITADAIGAAFGLPVGVREDARRMLLRSYPDESHLNEARLRMARVPEGASLIENPVSNAPGFRVENVMVMAGVPAVFRAMVETVRPTLAGGPPLLSWSFRVHRPEGEIAAPLGALAADHPEVSFGSYPFFRTAPGSVVVARSADREALTAAAAAVRGMCAALGVADAEETPPGG